MMQMGHARRVWILIWIIGVTSAVQVQAAAPVLSGNALVNAQEAVHDLLKGRWYQIEFILFERLDVLNYNTTENLLERDRYTWPNDLYAYALTEPDSTPPLLTPEEQALQARAQCIGWPDTNMPLEPHPLLEPDAMTMEELLEAELRENEALTEADQLLEAETEATTDVAAIDNELDPLLDETLTVEPEGAPEITEPVEPKAQEKFDAALTAFEQTLQAGALRFNEDNRSMITQVKYINRRRTLRPLMHLSWQQAVPPRDAPLAVMLHYPQQADTNIPERLYGDVAITLGRYLHIDLDLRYFSPSLGWTPQTSQTTSNTTWRTQGEIPFSQSRRLRSGELHYLDHPKMGVLVRIDPVDVPVELAQQWADLRAQTTASAQKTD